MSHPDDEGNSVARRAFSAVRKLREGKSGSRAEAARHPGASTTSPAGPDADTAADDRADAADEDSPATPDTAETANQDPVVDAVVNEAPAAEGAESADPAVESAESEDGVEVPAPAEDQATAADPTTASAEPTNSSGDDEQPAGAEDNNASVADPHTDEPVADEPVTDQTADSQTVESAAEPEAAQDAPDEPPVQTTPDRAEAEAVPADEQTVADGQTVVDGQTVAADKTGATDNAATEVKAPPQDTAGEQPGGAPAPAPSEAATAQFDAVPAVSTSTPSATESSSTTKDEPVGSPADENETEVMAATAAPAEVTDEPTERISATKAAPTTSSLTSNTGSPPDTGSPSAEVPHWKPGPAPQYIPPAGGAQQNRTGGGPTKSGKGLWFALAALVLIAAVVAAVIAVVASGEETSEVPADVAAARALEYTTALRDGDIITLRQITCGQAEQRFTSMSDEEFAEDHRIQEENNELVGVDGVKASKIVNDGNGAVVEVIAYKTLTPDEKLDVALTLSKIDGEWKVCKA